MWSSLSYLHVIDMMLILCAEFFRLEDFHLHLSLLHIPFDKDRLFWIDVSISCQLVQVSCLYWKSFDSFFLEPSVSENDHRALILMSGSCIPPSISDIRFWWQWRHHILYDCPGSTGRPSNIIALCCKNKCLMNTRGDKMRVVSTLSGKKANRFWWSPLFFIELIWKIL